MQNTQKQNGTHQDIFKLAGLELSSRLLLGTAGYPNQKSMLDAIEKSNSDMLTVSIRRISMENYQGNPIQTIIKKYKILPNTAGCETVQDAVLTAKLARESLKTDLIKLELIGDRYTLYPDAEKLLKAAEILVKDGFKVLPYCTDDIVLCQKLADIGCVAVMPLGSPIGSGLGISNPYNIEIIAKKITVPVILDAGIGTPSDAVKAMELGCSAVLLNTAVSKAEDPATMAHAFHHAVIAGRLAFKAKRMIKKPYGDPSSPKMGLIGS